MWRGFGRPRSHRRAGVVVLLGVRAVVIAGIRAVALPGRRWRSRRHHPWGVRIVIVAVVCVLVVVVATRRCGV